MNDSRLNSKPRRRMIFVAASFFATLGLLLSGCANIPDPETTVDSLREIAEDPEPEETSEALEEEAEPEKAFEPIECSPYLVITVRGTGEPVKGQLLSPVARTISETRPDDMIVVNLDYPADTEMKEGATTGVRNLVTMLNAQAGTCPEQQFVLLGYSQGSLILNDALSAPEARVVGMAGKEVSANASTRIAAIVFYANPRFLGQEPFNAGTFNPNLNGIISRDLGSLDTYGDRIQDYCVAEDFVCQISTHLNEEGHVAYFDNGMQEEGAAFAITMLGPLD